MLMLDRRGETGSTAHRPQLESSLKPVFSLVLAGSAVKEKIKYDNWMKFICSLYCIYQ